MSQDEGSFFSRWSRRKAQVRQGVPPVDTPPASPAADRPLPTATSGARPMANPPQAALQEPSQATSPVAAPSSAAAAAPPPTLEDVQALTPESDFSRFVARDVDPQVKNLAMKKLFADPHFNVMDGLDTYIDDYNTPDPLPKAMLRQLVQARSLGLLDDEMPEQPAPPQEAAAVDQPPTSPDGAGEPVDDGAVVEAAPVEGAEFAALTQAPSCVEAVVKPADPAADQVAVPRSSSES